MNLEYFIARKVATGGQQSFSRLIIRIAIASVALCVSVMIIASALISGFKKEISDKVFGFWGHIHITDTNVNRSVLEVYPVNKNQAFYPHLDTIGEVTVQELVREEDNEYFVEHTTFGGIRHIQTYALKPGIIKQKNQAEKGKRADYSIEGIILKGVGSDFDESFMQRYLQAGRLPDLKGDKMSREILISRQTADRLKVDVDSSFIVYFVENNKPLPRKFKVSGIYRTGLEDYDRRFALVDIRQLQRIYGWNENQVGGFEVFIDDIRDLDVLTEYVYLEELPKDMYAENIREKFPPIFDWLELQDVNKYVIIILMLVVSIINMSTALLILILERTNMIGTLKALGSTNWSIQKLFLYYGALIILWGLFIGNVVGLGICWLQDKFQFIKLSEADYYLSYAPIAIDWTMVIALNIGTLFFTVLMLLIPSFLVTRISPVKAIRFK